MTAHNVSGWTAFWFSPSRPSQLTWIRRGLCAVTAVYFASAIADVDTWYVRGAPSSSTNLATFFRTAELTSDARWMVSPLFIWDSVFATSALGESALVYRGYLLLGILLASLVGFSDRLGRFELPGWCARLVRGSWLPALLWIWFVGWANRVVLLAGVVEPVLSVSLAAIAIAPSASAGSGTQQPEGVSWRATLSRRLLAVQATLISILTTATMLASPTWWNGTGAYALVAPEEDRLFSATDTAFRTPLIYESTTALIVCLLPIGIVLAWRTGTRKWGIGLVVGWCGLVGFLSANLLYAATLGIIVTAIGTDEAVHISAGASGAEKLDGGNVDVTP